MEIYNELESLGFFEWLSETHNLKDTDITPEYLDELPLNDIHITVCNSMAFRWFREKYDLTHFINKQITDGEFICAIIKDNNYHKNTTWAKYHPYMVADKDGNGVTFKTFEEAELACLRKLIEIVKEK